MKINIDKQKKITLYNPGFDEMRHTLDQSIQATLKQLIRKDMSAAKINLSIDINLIKDEITDANAPTGYREAITPDIGWKLAYVLQQKADTKGDVNTKDNGKELLMDENEDFFLVDKEEASGQLSMFNTWDEYVEEVVMAE